MEWHTDRNIAFNNCETSGKPVLIVTIPSESEATKARLFLSHPVFGPVISNNFVVLAQFKDNESMELACVDSKGQDLSNPLSLTTASENCDAEFAAWLVKTLEVIDVAVPRYLMLANEELSAKRIASAIFGFC